MSDVLRIVAVDDEKHALRRLEIVLGDMPGVELVGTALSSRAALELIKQRRPDVVLLDIAMPEMSGLELAERLGEDSGPVVVFVTAYDHHAVEAFERSAVDYLLKPVEVDRLARALDRARHRGTLRVRQAQTARLRGLVAELRAGSPASSFPGRRYESEFWAHRHNEFVRVPVETLVWVEAERDYVRLHQHAGSCLLYESISGMMQRLDPDVFVQVHRSTIVRAADVVAVRRGMTGVMVAQLASGDQVNVGRKFAKDFATFLSRLGRPSAMLRG